MRREFVLVFALFVAIFFGGTNSWASILMVYPNGSGNYPDIQSAVEASADGDTIMLGDGTFVGASNIDVHYNGKAITVCSQSGNAAACIIDVQGQMDGRSQRGFVFDHNEGNGSILKDLTIINGSADAPCPDCDGGAIYVYYASPLIINVIFRDNFGASGGAVGCTRGSTVIRNCQFIDNSAFEGGGLYGLDSAQAIIEYCLFSGNRADLRGGGVSLLSNCAFTINNCTVSNNKSQDGSGIASWDSHYIINNSIVSFNDSGSSFFKYGLSDYVIKYTDIFGNPGGDWVDTTTGLPGANGNINQDPQFVDTLNGDYHLTQTSPCIDAGDPTFPHDPDGTVADMGAFYFNQSSLVDDGIRKPSDFYLAQNYPNPFNPSTTIEYYLPTSSFVKIEIYDITGRQVATPVEEIQDAGRHSITWNAVGQASGIYLYRIQADNDCFAKRMVLLK